MSRLKHPREHDDFVNFLVKRAIAVGGAPAVRLCEGRYGITRSEWRMVAMLVEGGPMSPTDLAARCRLDTARVALLVSAVVRKGLVQRTRATETGRRVELAATDDGTRLYAELFPQLAAINRRLMAVFSEAESQQLDRLLTRLYERAVEIDRARGAGDVRSNRYLGGGKRDALRRAALQRSRSEAPAPTAMRTLAGARGHPDR